MANNQLLRTENNKERTTGNSRLATKSEIRDTRYEMRVFIQNKPNVKIGKINVTFLATKPYVNELRTMNYELASKQTQYKPNSNPIQTQNKPNRKMGKISATFFGKKAYLNELRAMNYELDAKQTQTNPISKRQTEASPPSVCQHRGQAPALSGVEGTRDIFG
jgi:hypothetical protein